MFNKNNHDQEVKMIDENNNIGDILHINKIPDKNFLKKYGEEFKNIKNKITYKIIINDDLWVKFITNKNLTLIEKIIYSKNWFGPKKIRYSNTISWSSKNKYYINHVEWFSNDKERLNINKNHIDMISDLEKISRDDFYLPTPPKKYRDALDKYFLFSKIKDTEEFNNCFLLSNDLDGFQEKIKKLTFENLITNSTSKESTENYSEQENFKMPYFSKMIPSYVLSYKNKIQSKDKGDKHDVVLTNVYLHLFKDKIISIYKIRYKIDNKFIAEFNPLKKELSYKQIKIGSEKNEDEFGKDITITLTNNCFPITYKRILLPMALAKYGLPRVFEFNIENDNFKNKLNFKQGYKTEIIKKLYKKYVQTDLNYMAFAFLFFKQKRKDGIDEIIKIAENYQHGISTETRELLVMNYQYLNDEIPKINRYKKIHDFYFKTIKDYSEINVKNPVSLIDCLKDV